MGGPGSGRKNKAFEWEVTKLKALAYERAIKALEKDLKTADNYALKVIEKSLPEEIKLNGLIGQDINIVFDGIELKPSENNLLPSRFPTPYIQ